MMLNPEKKAPWTALVLSGGGAKGAYEAGIIRYIREELPPRVRAHVRFEIICGASVGAINCCFLAASNHTPEYQGKLVSDVWLKLHINDVYHLSWNELKNLPKFLLGSKGRGELDESIGPGRLGGLFNTSPLEKLVRHAIRWDDLYENIASANLQALAINATHIESGKTHVFVQKTGAGLPPWSTDPNIMAFPVEIGPEHALASSAIPWIFPAVEINGEAYYDGGLKLNTPISPAIRLGADRLLVIGLRNDTIHSEEVARAKVESYPSASYLLGKLLNALLTDKTDYDLTRLERFNRIVESVYDKDPQLWGHLSREMTHLRGAPYRKISTLVIRPSENIADIAGKHLRMGGIIARAGGLVGPLLKRLAETSEGQSNDLVSYLLFDREYAQDLIQLGMHDADAQRQKLIDFFSP